MSALASAELDMRPPTAPAATLPDIETRLGTSSNPAGKLCADCGAMNEASNGIWQDCCKSLYRKDIASLLLEQDRLCIFLLLF